MNADVQDRYVWVVKTEEVRSTADGRMKDRNVTVVIFEFLAKHTDMRMKTLFGVENVFEAFEYSEIADRSTPPPAGEGNSSRGRLAATPFCHAS
uniref:Glycogen(starch) synthase n=1 Tax=Panagrellus redivivus TaxID=6233 RepID=A0A7E4W373_PANRE